MDDRKLQLKQLKKASKREKRRHVTFWKFLAVLLLILAVLSTVAVAVLIAFEEILKMVEICECLAVVRPYMDEALAVRRLIPDNWAALAAAVLWVLYLIAAILHSYGKKKWKKTEAYLDYMTMKNTLKQEKKM